MLQQYFQAKGGQQGTENYTVLHRADPAYGRAQKHVYFRSGHTDRGGCS